MLHLAGTSQASLKWSVQHRKAAAAGAADGAAAAADGVARPRVTLLETGQQPCALHANGPSKPALPHIERWWDNPKARPRWRRL